MPKDIYSVKLEDFLYFWEKLHFCSGQYSSPFLQLLSAAAKSPLYYFLSASQVFHLCQPKTGLTSCPAWKDAFLFVLFVLWFACNFTKLNQITKSTILVKFIKIENPSFSTSSYNLDFCLPNIYFNLHFYCSNVSCRSVDTSRNKF